MTHENVSRRESAAQRFPENEDPKLLIGADEPRDRTKHPPRGFSLGFAAWVFVFAAFVMTVFWLSALLGVHFSPIQDNPAPPAVRS